jgi:hypothetical protein
MRPTNEIMIDYLDKELGPEETTRIEHILQHDAAAKSEWQYLNLAVETIQLDSISEKVMAVRNSFRNNMTTTAKPEQAIVHTMFKISMRIAAILIVLISCAVFYKYASVNDQSVYNKQFTGYELSNVRGQETQNMEVEAYRNKNWNEVVSIYNNQNDKSNRSIFLAAMSQMELKHFPQAVALFENILKSDDNSFREETEYYLSLAYLMNHQENKSILLLNKIKADTGHTYYPLSSKLSPIDLKIIELKK